MRIMTLVDLALLILGLVVLIHFTFVNINIGLGVYSIILRWIGLKITDAEESARKVFKFLVASEIVSGVWGTMITVVLAGLFPMLLNIATIILFIPILVSLIGILLRMVSIVAFWYTWGRINPNAHLGIGIIMATSGFMIPGGFRYIFALINNPHGITSLSPTISGDPIEALSNPVYPPLILHTWFGALSIGFLAAAAGLAWASKQHKPSLHWSGLAGLIGGLLIVPQGLSGFWYWSTLAHYSQYLFNSIMVPMLPSDIKPAIITSHSFLTMVVIGLMILILGIVHHYRPEPYKAYILLILAILALYMGEITNDLGRYPYMVIIGSKGIPIEAFINPLITLNSEILIIGLIPITIMMIVFIVLLYLYLVRGFMK